MCFRQRSGIFVFRIVVTVTIYIYIYASIYVGFIYVQRLLDGIYTYKWKTTKKRQKNKNSVLRQSRGEYFDIGSTMSAKARFPLPLPLPVHRPDVYRNWIYWVGKLSTLHGESKSDLYTKRRCGITTITIIPTLYVLLIHCIPLSAGRDRDFEMTEVSAISF